MAHLPRVTWQDVATTADLAALETSLRSDIHMLRADMQAGFADVRAEIREGFAGVSAEFADVRAEMHRAVVEQTRWLIGSIRAWSALVVTVARLIL